MKVNINLENFIKGHKKNKNQILFHKTDCTNNKIVENIIKNCCTECPFLFRGGGDASEIAIWSPLGLHIVISPASPP